MNALCFNEQGSAKNFRGSATALTLQDLRDVMDLVWTGRRRPSVDRVI
jgi:hypothetical protein